MSQMNLREGAKLAGLEACTVRRSDTRRPNNEKGRVYVRNITKWRCQIVEKVPEVVDKWDGKYYESVSKGVAISMSS